MDQFIETLVNFFTNAGARIILGIAIIIIGLIIAKLVKVVLKRIFDKAKRDEALTHFVISLVDVTLKVVIFISALATMGVNTASIITVLGTCGVAIGLALKDSLSNLAGGILIIFNKPFKKGDYIQTPDVEGTVETINLFNTTLITSDNKEVVIPNSDLSSEHLVNFTTLGERRLDIEISVALNADFRLAQQVILEVTASYDKIIDREAPICRVTRQTDTALVLLTRVWVKSGDYTTAQFDLNELIKEALDSVSIPYPAAKLRIEK